jgi:hypothetical protein
MARISRCWSGAEDLAAAAAAAAHPAADEDQVRVPLRTGVFQLQPAGPEHRAPRGVVADGGRAERRDHCLMGKEIPAVTSPWVKLNQPTTSTRMAEASPLTPASGSPGQVVSTAQLARC